MRVRSTLLSFVLAIRLLPAQSQTVPKAVPEDEVRNHLTQHSDPIYPAIAKAVGAEGDVTIAIVIDVNGKIVSEKVKSGNSLLQGAALDAVKQWRFSPFEQDGNPVSVSSILTIPFQISKPANGPTAEQQKAAQAWFPVSDKCRNALKTPDTQGAVEVCKQALNMALQAGNLTSSDQLALVESHQYYAHALIYAGKPQEAIEQADKAMEIAKLCLKDTDQEYAMPFFWRALAEARLGKVELAQTDFSVAEETHRKAIQHLPDMKQTYSKYLSSILKTHAALLEQLGDKAKADKLRAEAASL